VAVGSASADDERLRVRRTSWIALWVLSVGWGTVGVATRAAFERGVGTLTVVGGRLLIASVVVLVVQLVARRNLAWRGPEARTGVVMAVVGVAMPFVFFNVAYQHASAGFVGLMAALTPLGTAIFAHRMIPGEALTRRRMLGMGIAIAGVAVLLLSGESGLVSGGRPHVAVAWSIPGVAAFSFSTVYAKRRSVNLGIDVLAVQFTTAAALIIGPMIIREGLPDLDLGSWGLLAYLAIGSTVLPVLLFYWVLQRNSAAQTALVGYMVPLVAVLAGIVILSERAGAGLVAGGLAIILGVTVADRGGGPRRALPT
jgi:drug/metabolite transporter (DMT)-like permease